MLFRSHHPFLMLEVTFPSVLLQHDWFVHDSAVQTWFLRIIRIPDGTVVTIVGTVKKFYDEWNLDVKSYVVLEVMVHQVCWVREVKLLHYLRKRQCSWWPITVLWPNFWWSAVHQEVQGNSWSVVLILQLPCSHCWSPWYSGNTKWAQALPGKRCTMKTLSTICQCFLSVIASLQWEATEKNLCWCMWSGKICMQAWIHCYTLHTLRCSSTSSRAFQTKHWFSMVQPLVIATKINFRELIDSRRAFLESAWCF